MKEKNQRQSTDILNNRFEFPMAASLFTYSIEIFKWKCAFILPFQSMCIFIIVRLLIAVGKFTIHLFSSLSLFFPISLQPHTIQNFRNFFLLGCVTQHSIMKNTRKIGIWDRNEHSQTERHKKATQYNKNGR